MANLNAKTTEAEHKQLEEIYTELFKRDKNIIVSYTNDNSIRVMQSGTTQFRTRTLIELTTKN